MNFYPHHVGDFNNSTRHLTRVERSVYRDAIELYYDTESALTPDIEKLCRKLLCVSDEEKCALNVVLDEFFLNTEGGFIHERCDIEIAKYRSNTNAKARAGIASAAKRKQKLTYVEHVFNGCATNQEPITNNQEPITNIKTTAPEKPARFDPKDLPMPLGLKATKWGEWVSFRTKLPKPPKRETWEKQIEFLANQISIGSDAASIIDYSIRNGYTGLFEPKQQSGKTQFLTAQQQRDENNRRSTEEFLADDGEFFGQNTKTINGEYTSA